MADTPEKDAPETRLPPDALRRAVALFNAGDFYACHEIIEDDLWRPMPAGDEKDFYQGILQVGVGFYHLLNKNERGARNLMANGLEKLTRFTHQSPFSIWMDVAGFVEKTQAVHEKLLKTSDMSEFNDFKARFPQINLVQAHKF